jgi:anaerobic selenocysteine-containing dehydrogenase
VTHGNTAVLEAASGRIEVLVEVTDSVMPGVVCLPHGWAPETGGTWAQDATSGSNVNLLTPSTGMDPLTGTAVLNAVPVRLQAH